MRPCRRQAHPISKVLEIIDTFSDASGLKFNIPKCEIICLYDTHETTLHNIPVKLTVKYLGIHVCKQISVRQEMNFIPKLKKAKLRFNNWLQRDLSFPGRILLTKAEGLSNFIYPTISLFVHDNTCEQI